MNFFDFNHDGKTSWSERMLAYEAFKYCTEDEDTELDFNHSSSDDLFDNDYSWRETCDDGDDYDIDPFDYETEAEYDEALNEAKLKYGWRETCDDGEDYDVYPEDYETEAEYNEALQEAKYGWRKTCEDGSAYNLNPCDYETEEDYEDDLEEAKEAWRYERDDGDDYDIDPFDYETEAEYDEALNEAKLKYGWRETCEDGANYGVYPEGYETEAEYVEALEEAKESDRENCVELGQYILNLCDEKFKNAIIEACTEAVLAKLESRQEDSKNEVADDLKADTKTDVKYEQSDKTIYTVCGVLLEFSNNPYSYRTEDESICVGDDVIVPVGYDNKPTKGTVVSVGKYLRSGLSFPIERTKTIIKKAEE